MSWKQEQFFLSFFLFRKFKQWPNQTETYEAAAAAACFKARSLCARWQISDHESYLRESIENH